MAGLPRWRFGQIEQGGQAEEREPDRDADIGRSDVRVGFFGQAKPRGFRGYKADHEHDHREQAPQIAHAPSLSRNAAQAFGWGDVGQKGVVEYRAHFKADTGDDVEGQREGGLPLLRKIEQGGEDHREERGPHQKAFAIPGLVRQCAEGGRQQADDEHDDRHAPRPQNRAGNFIVSDDFGKKGRVDECGDVVGKGRVCKVVHHPREDGFAGFGHGVAFTSRV